MKVKFWGVRGSVPTPWKEAVEVGGNTSCVQVTPDNGQLIILDAGTGLRFLGEHLNATVNSPIEGHLLLSHAHWDHIQGFPFFMPAYKPGNTFTLYGATRARKPLEAIMSGQMEAPYFPIQMTQMAAQLNFVDLQEETFWIQDLKVTTCSFKHPGGVFGFRLEHNDQVLVFATDMEYSADDLDPRLIAFAQDADLLIYDAQYTPEEFEQKRGWGHSTHLAAARLGQLASVKRVMLYHHDPSHNDQMLEVMEQEAQAIYGPCQLAKEGLIMDTRTA